MLDGRKHFYYTETEFEASSLNRATKAMAVGNSWNGNAKGVEQEYLANTLDDDV